METFKTHVTFALLLVALAITIMLSGCQIPPAPPVPQIKYVLVEPSTDLLVDCGVSKPPTPQTYISADPTGRTAQLYAYSSALLNDLTQCNKHWSELRQWFVDQKKVYSKP